jgi:hypothetical protein
MDTERLIYTLAEELEPVSPLRRPWHRTMVWAAAGAIYLALLVRIMSPRDDLALRLQDPWFLLEQGAALLTGLTAAAAAFATSIPGHRRDLVWLSFAFAAVWVAIVGMGALRDARLADAGAILFQADWACVWTVLAGAAVPAGAMAMMLRRGVPLTPHLTAALGGLGAAGLGNLGVCVFHPHSSNLIVLVWHCGTVLAVAAIAGIVGRQLLRWPARPHATYM